VITYRTTQVRLEDPIVVDTRTRSATVTTTIDGEQTTFATFDLSRAHVDASGGVTAIDSALAYLTPEGAARLSALLGAGDVLAPGALFFDLEATAPAA